MDMIDTNYLPTPIGPTVPQLRGPWAIATANQPVLPPKVKAVLSLSSAAISAFHGVRRNGGSIFWGVWWFVLGGIFPVITPIVGAAQGFGQCKYNCRAPATVMNGLGRARAVGSRCRGRRVDCVRFDRKRGRR